MPIYFYRCDSCGFEKEHLQKMNDPVLRVCPDCGQATYSKQVTAAGFQLKGSGWYATDFKNGGKPAKQEKPATADTPAEKSEAAAPACPCAPEVAAACGAK